MWYLKISKRLLLLCPQLCLMSILRKVLLLLLRNTIPLSLLPLPLHPLPHQVLTPHLLTTFPPTPREAPAFLDPSLLNSISIFLDKSPLSPSTLPLDSIHFKNVTIRKAKKPSSEDFGSLGLYTPLSTRLKNVARHPRTSPSSSQVLRASILDESGFP